uniref:HECT-type E3 ubiquitin transferase n=1 Tax=Timema shepardi TaxID=629360 RepID=A0A7R9G0S9_TIMSH|nr:unnamed protein product [Timema shepardi]
MTKSAVSCQSAPKKPRGYCSKQENNTAMHGAGILTQTSSSQIHHSESREPNNTHLWTRRINKHATSLHLTKHAPHLVLEDCCGSPTIDTSSRERESGLRVREGYRTRAQREGVPVSRLAGCRQSGLEATTKVEMCSTEEHQEVFSIGMTLHPSSSTSSGPSNTGCYRSLQYRLLQVPLIQAVTGPSNTGCYRSLQYRLLQVPLIQAVTGPSNTGCYRSRQYRLLQVPLIQAVTGPSNTGCYRSLQYRLLQVPLIQAVTGPFNTGCYRSRQYRLLQVPLIQAVTDHEDFVRLHLKALLVILAIVPGISNLVNCAQLEDLPELPAHDEERLQRASQLLQQRLILRQWLGQHNLQHHYQRLLQVDVSSLDDVYWLEDSKARVLLQVDVSSLDDVYWLEDSKATVLLGKDFVPWAAARQALPTSKDDLALLKGDLWSAVVKSTQHEDAWTWGGMLVVSVSVAGLVTLAAMTQPALAPEAKHTLLQYVTGKYLLPGNCKVHFEWDDPQVVGGTMTFTVKFYQRNGQPYPICDTDNLFVEVTEGTRRVATVSELGGTDPSAANVAVVKFTVRHAGQYHISVLIGSCHVQGSPFVKHFLPGQTSLVYWESRSVWCDICSNMCAGPPDPNKSVFVRHSSIVVCTAGVAHSLAIEPRDEFNNLCVFQSDENPTQGYAVAISQSDENPTRGYAVAITQVTTLSLFPQIGCNDPVPCSVTLEYEEMSHRISLQVRFSCEGCFHAKVSYRGVELNNGDFDIIVLSCEYGAWLKLCFTLPPESSGRMKPRSGGSDGLPLSSVSSVPPAVLTKCCVLVLSGGSETFKDKQDFFYHEVRKFHQKHYHEKLPLKVNREKLLESSLKATKGFSVSDWCRNFEITFQGEQEGSTIKQFDFHIPLVGLPTGLSLQSHTVLIMFQGLDWGGVRREWFELTCAALFDAKNGLFTSFSESQQALVHPNPRRPPHLKLKHYEFAGKLVGKCLYESALGGSYRQLVRARFTRSFLAQIIGLRVHYKYFEQDDPDLYLSKVKYILEHDVEDMELFFIEEEYDRFGQLLKVVELVTGGSKIRVGNATKHQYLDALAQYRLATSLKDEVEQFLKGLNELIPDNLLSIFDENELELLLCGTGEYSIADFRAHHVMNGGSSEFRRILDWFWTAVSNFTQEEMARLLQFTTGCSQLPPGGFAELSPRFQLTAAPTFGSLPTAHTCFNQLCLPDYESYEQFEKALLLAISEGTEGFGMI